MEYSRFSIVEIRRCIINLIINLIERIYRNEDFHIRRKAIAYLYAMLTIILCVSLYLLFLIISHSPYTQDIKFIAAALFLLSIGLLFFLKGKFKWSANCFILTLLLISSAIVYFGQTKNELKLYNMAFLHTLVIIFTILVAQKKSQIITTGSSILLIIGSFLYFQLLPAAQGSFQPYYSSYAVVVVFIVMETIVGLMIYDVLSLSLSEIRYKAEHDESSGLPNKKSLMRHMKEYRKGGEPYTLSLYSIENYTELLLNLGSEQVLAAVLNTADLIRKTHGYDVFHTSADILGCLAPEAEPVSVKKIDKILELMHKPLLCNDIYLKINIRASLTCSDAESMEWRQNYNHGLLTLSEARHKSNDFMIFETLNKKKWQYRLGLLHQLASSIEEGNFKAVYQPLFDSRKRIIGYEALSRWNNSDGEAVSPGLFVPLLEESGLISDFSLHMLEQVLSDMNEYSFLMEPAPVYINLSAALINENFDFDLLTAQIDAAGIPHEKIGFEITETMLIRNSIKFKKVFEYLKQQNFLTALDDFGTGYSNLSRILELPFDKIKIDQSFVRGIKESDRNREMLKMFIEIINRVGCISLIEGIETEEEMEEFRQMNCLEYQGYYLSRPQSPEYLKTHIRELLSTETSSGA